VDPSDETMPKAGVVSRGIAKEIRAAQSALQLGQWQGVLEKLEAAEGMSPLTAFDLKTIDDFKAYAYLKLKSFKEAQSSYEAELATGALTVQETVNVFRMLFRLSAGNEQHAKPSEYGAQLAAKDNDSDKPRSRSSAASSWTMWSELARFCASFSELGGAWTRDIAQFRCSAFRST
jgi:hypothetical protein